MTTVLRRGGRWVLWMLSAAVSLGAVVAAVLVLSLDRLPALLSAIVAHLVPAFELDVGDARVHGWSGLDLERVRLRPRGETAALLAADRLELRFSLPGLRRGHLDEVRVTAPVVDVPDMLPDLGGDDGGDAPAWSIGRLVVTDGRLRVAPGPSRPGATAEVAFDLRDLGTTPEVAGRRQRVRFRRLAVGYPEQPPVLAAEAVIARFTVSNLLERRHLDELRLVTPVITVPDPLPVAAAGGDAGEPTPWTLGRLVSRDGRIDAAPTAQRPGAALAFRLDVRDLGLGPEHARRRHRVHLRDLAVALAPRTAPSVVLDAARVEFTLGEVLDARRVGRVRIEGGVAVLDQRLRAWLAGDGPSASSAPGPAGPEWHLGRLDVVDLGVRLGDLGADIPDVTLLVHTVLRNVPLGPAGLADAREPQRIELADLTLYSPLDPFRRVVRIASIFVEFTLADLVRERIDAITLVSPTIYLGEDLIWYMNAQRSETAAAGGPSPWTVRRVAAELGRVVVTFEGADRLQLPIAFHTTAHDVRLDDLATLRLAADLVVPKQSYRFPGFDIDLVDVEGALRFDYPPGRARENVVNVLRAGEIRWGDYRIGDAWLSVTFDESGINGELGGSAYGGYTNAGLSVPFSAGTRSAWIAGDRLDLAPFTTQLSSGRAVMTGHATFEGALTLDGTRLDTASGELALLGPGELDFPDLDTLPERLGPDAPAWQRDLARIAAAAFQDWPWTTGEGSLRMADFRGTATLTVTGTRGGSRHVEAHYYDDIPVVADAGPTP